MITTKGQLYQWDTGRIIEAFPITDYKVDEIHVYNGTTPFALVLKTWVENGRTYAKIPDSLLQSDNNMDIYAIMSDDLGEYTTEHVNVTVLSRARPEDYVYSEEDAKIWSALEKRVKALEESGGKGTVKSVNNIKPDENGNIEVETASSWNDLEDKPFGEDVNEEMIIDSYQHTFIKQLSGSEVSGYNWGVTESLIIEDSSHADIWTEGEQITILWNGVEYNAEVTMGKSQYMLFSDFGCTIYLPSSETPSFIFYPIFDEYYETLPEGMNIGDTEEFPVTFSLYRKSTIIKQLDEKYLPDHTHSWNDLTDKPFDRYIDEQYENVFKSIYFGGEWITNLDSLSNIVKENNVYNVTLLGESYNVVSEFNGTYLPAIAGYVESLMWIGNPSLIDANTELHLGSTNNLDLPFVIYWYGGEKDFSRITPKIITNIEIGNREELVVKRSMGEQLVYVQMEDGYLPDNIPKIQTAEVGQVIAVKAVDENGKPTEWEAVDAGASSWDELKNKPFYEEVSPVDIVPEQEVTFVDGVAKLSGVKDPVYDLGIMEDSSSASLVAILEIGGEVVEGTLTYHYVATGTFGAYSAQLGAEQITLLDGASVNDGDTVNVHMYAMINAVTTLDEKFIPPLKYVSTDYTNLTEKEKNNVKNSLDIVTLKEVEIFNGNKSLYISDTQEHNITLDFENEESITNYDYLSYLCEVKPTNEYVRYVSGFLTLKSLSFVGSIGGTVYCDETMEVGVFAHDDNTVNFNVKRKDTNNNLSVEVKNVKLYKLVTYY